MNKQLKVSLTVRLVEPREISSIKYCIVLGRYGCWFYSLNILTVLVPQELELEVSQLRQDREQLETDCKKIQTNLNSKTQLLNTQEEVRRVCD